MTEENRLQIVKDIQNILMVIIDENHWCKRSLCADIDGNVLFDPFTEEATKWCIYGALYKSDASAETFTYLKNMCKYFGYSDLDRLNDLGEHYQVIQFLQFCLTNLGGWFKLVKPLYLLKLKKDIL